MANQTSSDYGVYPPRAVQVGENMMHSNIITTISASASDNMYMFPIPPDCLEGSKEHWRPYVLSIAERASNPLEEMERMLYAGEAQAFLVWNPESQCSHAFIGVEYRGSTKGRVGQIIWLMGEDRKAWIHLFADLETYLRDQQSCVAVRPVARRGWAKFLKANGYRETHVVMEKSL